MNVGELEKLDPEVRRQFVAIIDAAKGPDLVARVRATGTVTDEEIAAEIVERNAVHDRWVAKQL